MPPPYAQIINRNYLDRRPCLWDKITTAPIGRKDRTMNDTGRGSTRFIPIAIFFAALGYALFYFNYFETPTGDYIGNIRVPVLEYMKGNFPGDNFKFLPLYPLTLSVLARIAPPGAFDPIYLTAMALNLLLFIPYIILCHLLYRKFLPEKTAWGALIILSVNIYTVYSAVNSELEMLLSLLIILSLYLTTRDSKISYASAFLAALTKWDAVFIIPAVMFRDFFYRKKRISAMVLGAAATTGVATWMLLSFIKTSGNPYVSEIAHRGPNIYRYIIDCFLVTGGFTQWMAVQGWFSDSLPVRIALLGLVAITGITTVAGTVWGAVLIIKDKAREFAPVLIFFGGFLLIHLIYQNTKDRYVLPILWILTLFLSYGVVKGIIPFLRARFDRIPVRVRKPILLLLLAACGAIYAVSLWAIIVENTPYHVIFALIFTALMATVMFYGNDLKYPLNTTLAIIASAIVINLLVFYGVRTLDHHSLSRVEFKKAALWYREHARPDDRMLISETNVPKYYSGFGDDKFIMSYIIRGTTIEELVPELKDKKATYVFVDDFYIRRLAVKDPNAIDRRAWIFREIRDRGEKTGHFKLVTTFHTKGGITSYLYRFNP